MNPPHRGNSVRFTREFLLQTRRRLVRRKAWFTALNRAERGIIDLTIRCVKRVRSPRLASLLKKILAKVSEVLKSQFLRIVRVIGEPLARRTSQIARFWGNLSASNWATDVAFIRYLGVMQINAKAKYQIQPAV